MLPHWFKNVKSMARKPSDKIKRFDLHVPIEVTFNGKVIYSEISGFKKSGKRKN